MYKSLPEIKAMLKKNNKQVIVMIVLLILSMVMFFIFRPAAILCLVAALLFYFLVVRPLQKEYTRVVIENHLLNTTCKYLGQKTVTEKGPGVITPELITASQLMPVIVNKGTPLIMWQVAGTRMNLEMALADTVLALPSSASGGKGRIHQNVGVWSHVKLNNPTGLRFFAYTSNSIPESILVNHMNKMTDFKSTRLPEGTTDKNIIYYVLKDDEKNIPPESFVSELKRFRNYTPGGIAVSVDDDHMDCFVYGRLLTGPVGLSKEVTQEFMNKDLFPEFNNIAALAQSL